MPRTPDREPPCGTGGHAAERLRQFEVERGWAADEPASQDDAAGPVDRPDADTADEVPGGEGTRGERAVVDAGGEQHKTPTTESPRAGRVRPAVRREKDGDDA